MKSNFTSRKASLVLFFMLIGSLIFAGCGGSGGGSIATTDTTGTTTGGGGTTDGGGTTGDGGTTTGGGASSATPLQITGKVSVVEATPATSAKPVQKVLPLAISKFKLSAAPNLPAASDYSKDKQEIYVHERSAESFGIINEILCMIGQAGYDQSSLLNKGPYKAQIDANQCDSDRDSTSEQGQQSQNQSSGSDAPDYETWTVDSSRAAGDSSPHIVKLWIRQEAEEHEPAQTINAKMTITEGKSATNPYGLFEIQFQAIGPNNQELFKGFLKSTKDSSGKILLQFFGKAADDRFLEKVTLDRASDGLSGGGTVYMKETSGGGEGGGSSQVEEVQFDMAFNTTFFTRKDALPTSSTFGTQTCLSRTEFTESAWRYGCYDTDGKRVQRNSGFPIRFPKEGKDYYGWVGYWGVGLQENVTVSNGDTVYKQTFGSGGATEEPMTVVNSNGKLIKHTKQTLTLGEIKGIPLHYHDQTVNPPAEFRVVWDGMVFKKIEKLDKTTFFWEKLTPEQSVSLTNLNFCDLNFWSQALGGNVRVQLTCIPTNVPGVFTGSASNDTAVVSYREDIVYPSDTIPSTLACFDRCPDPAKFSTPDPFTSPTNFQVVPPSTATRIDYIFDTTGMVLQKGGTPVVLTEANTTFEWGIRSGVLFDPTNENLSKLACKHNPAHTCGWNVWNVFDVFYTWETGVNHWNRFTALKKSDGTILKFDPPLQVKYVHNGDSYTGATFYLEYAGFGQLHGIPGKCVNFETGVEEGCGQNSRWIPQFSIADGSTVTDYLGKIYYVKALEKEQRMVVKPTSDCSALTLQAYTLPDISGYADPNTGTEPTVTNAPAVIGGILQ